VTVQGALRRWRSYIGVAVLLGLLGGLSLFAIAGARRTQSAYPRFLDAVDASTLSIGIPAGYDADAVAAVDALPEVVRSQTYLGFGSLILDEDGQPSPAAEFEANGTFDGRSFGQDRFTPTSGRMARPDRVDEVVVNEYMAEQLGLRVGQRLELGTYEFEGLPDPEGYETAPPPALRTTATIVGIGLFPDEVLQDEGDRTGRLLHTPAFSRAARGLQTYAIQGVVLRHGDRDVDAVKRRVSELFPTGTLDYRLTSVDEFHGVQATRPLAIALAIFGIVAGIAGLVLVAQALARSLRAGRTERATVRALGAGPRAILGSALAAPVLAIVAGAALAVGLAFLASPAMPIGPVRDVEVRSGFDVDGTVLGLGALGVVVLLVAFTVVITWRELPHHLARRPTRVRRPSRVVETAARNGASPVMTTGLRFALDPGSGDAAVPSRSLVLGTVVAVTALVGAVTFGASLGSLVGEPRLYGWDWDAVVLSGNGYDNLEPAATDAALGDQDSIETRAGAYFGSDSVDDVDTPLLGMSPGAPLSPPITAGRALAGANEVVLGQATASQLGKGIGDTVRVGSRRVEVVGIATFPTIGIVHAAHPSLGVGALVAPELVPGFDRDILDQPASGQLGPNAMFVRFEPGVDPDAALVRLRRASAPLAGFAGLDVLPVQRPAEIVNATSLRRTPVLLAGALALGTSVSLALALAASVRRRRRDLAVLRTIGFTSRQLTRAVSWQATIVVVLGLVVGVPLGIALGRALWARFADQLDVLSQPTIPAVVVTAIGAGALLVGILAAALPARAARRISAPALLRSE
jgi:hypothetical protein